MDYLTIKQHNDGLRLYQIEAKNKIFEAWNNYRSIMFQMPTGTGKTMLFSAIIKDLYNNYNNVRILILAHRTELIDQISKSLGTKYNIVHGKIKSGYSEEEYYNIQVASVQTLIKRLKERWDSKHFNYIIIDEAHHSLAKSYKKICKSYPEAKILGVTATPYRLNAEPFTKMFETLIVSQSIQRFISEGWLSDYKYYSIKSESSIQKKINNLELGTDGDYLEQSMLRALDIDEIRANLVNSYKKYANGKKGIIYTIDTIHNLHVCNNFKIAGYKAETIDCYTPLDQRNQIINLFKEGLIDIICNVNVFSEGFDCPDIEFIQLARPTLSLAMFLQQLGRGFRISKDKQEVIFIDNVGLYNRFGLPSVNRKWRYYFEGLHKGINITFPKGNGLDHNFNEIDDHFEGNEDVNLLFNSHNKNEEIEENFIFNDEALNKKNYNIIDMNNKHYNDSEYSTLKSTYEMCIRKGWDIPVGLLEEIKEYEQYIIESKIIDNIRKIIGDKNNSEFSFDFSLSVDYSRKTGFSINYDGRTFSPINDIENNRVEKNEKDNSRSGRTILKVTFKDGTTVFKRKAKDSFLECIEKIGVNRVELLNIYANGYPLVSDNKPDDYQYEILSNGKYLITQNSTNYKAKYLEEISQRLKLSLEIEIVNSREM